LLLRSPTLVANRLSRLPRLSRGSALLLHRRLRRDVLQLRLYRLHFGAELVDPASQRIHRVVDPLHLPGDLIDLASARLALRLHLLFQRAHR